MHITSHQLTSSRGADDERCDTGIEQLVTASEPLDCTEVADALTHAGVVYTVIAMVTVARCKERGEKRGEEKGEGGRRDE